MLLPALPRRHGSQVSSLPQWPDANRPKPGVSQPASHRRHVFVSYSHADREWVRHLRTMMAPILRRTGQELSLWDDSQIRPGVRWREEIKTALAEARVALLLVSANFLASEFVMGVEVPSLLLAAKEEGVPILWVSLSPGLWEHTPISDYQAVLPPSEHLAGLDGVKLQEALKAISLEIELAMSREEAESVAQQQPREDGNLDAIWEAILSNLELPSTRVLLAEQAKLLSIDSRRVVIYISATWMPMVQSRLPLIEKAVAAVLGSDPRSVVITANFAP